jgi:hypothetical protein
VRVEQILVIFPIGIVGRDIVAGASLETIS